MSARTRFTILAITLNAAVALPMAHAQTTASQEQPATTPATKPDSRDPDGDKRTSWEEYRGTMTANFVRLDANKDGVLESTEIPNQPAGQRMTRAQFDGNLRTGFDRLDASKDGYLAGEEMPSKTSAPPQK